MFKIKDFPEELLDPKNATLLSGILRGVEREALRVTPNGDLSQKPHPSGLGSALAHPQITTDFSESLLEFITPPTHRVEDLFTHIENIQRYTISQLDNELLWTSSMPCILNDDASIPVAQYGNSNNGKMKTVYRLGLGHRYGRAMQTVSGVHYNFSLPNAFWALLSHRENSHYDLQEFKNQKYFGLIRNFRRHYWLLIYLFGASPALCESFVSGKEHKLERFSDGHSLYLPYATSLRMSDLGYQSKAQESLYVCYNNVNSYMQSLCKAITKPYPEYETIGRKDADGNYKQLNDSILQIENEFYSSIRPKRTAYPGETALSALQRRGVEYIEVRCLDINPFTPYGVTEEQVRFLDTFLLYCALQNSPATDGEEARIILENQKSVVNYGRQPELKLNHWEKGEITLQEWGSHLLEGMEPIAKILDEVKGTNQHQKALSTQQAKLLDSALTPSAQVLQAMEENNQSYPEFALQISQKFHERLSKNPINKNTLERMEAIALESISEQKALEEGSTESFDQFIDNYYKQYNNCDCSNASKLETQLE